MNAMRSDDRTHGARCACACACAAAWLLLGGGIPGARGDEPGSNVGGGTSGHVPAPPTGEELPVAASNQGVSLDEATALEPEPAPRPAALAPREANATTRDGMTPTRRTAPGGADGVLLRGRTRWYQAGVIPLVVVLGGIGAVYLVVRRFIPSQRVAEAGVIRVCARAALGPKHSLALVRIGAARFVLVGVSGDGVSCVSDICDAEEVADLTARVDGAPGGDRVPFGALLDVAGDEFERVAEDAGDGVAPDPRGIERARRHVGGLLSRLRDMKEKVDS